MIKSGCQSRVSLSLLSLSLSPSVSLSLSFRVCAYPLVSSFECMERRPPVDHSSRYGEAGARPAYVVHPFARRWTKVKTSSSPSSPLAAPASQHSWPSPHRSGSSYSFTLKDQRASVAKPNGRGEAVSPEESFDFPVARASLSRSPVAVRDDGETRRLRKELECLQRENAILREHLALATAQPSDLVSGLQRQVQRLTAVRDAAEAALMDLRQDHMSFQEKLEKVLRLYSARQQPSSPLPLRGRSDSSLRGRRSQTMEGRQEPKPRDASPPPARISRPATAKTPPRTARTPSRPLFDDDDSANDSPHYSRAAALDAAIGRVHSKEGAHGGPRSVYGGRTANAPSSSALGDPAAEAGPGGIEELLRRSQRLREAVRRRKAEDHSYVLA